MPLREENRDGHIVHVMYVEHYQSKGGSFRWRYRAENGKVQESSHEGFHDLAECKANFHRNRADHLAADKIEWVDVQEK